MVSIGVVSTNGAEMLGPTDVKHGAAAEGTGGETILLVEDDLLLRRVMTRVLQSAGYRVLAAEDGEVAIGLWQKHGTEIGLVISDSAMPKIGGLGLFQFVMGERPLNEPPPLPFLFCSGFPEGHVGFQEVSGPGRSFLLKPFETLQLRSEVRRLLTGAKQVAQPIDR